MVLILAGIGLGWFAIYKQAEWQAVVAVSAIPILAAVLLFLFTTWGDIAEAGKAFFDK